MRIKRMVMLAVFAALSIGSVQVSAEEPTCYVCVCDGGRCLCDQVPCP